MSTPDPRVAELDKKYTILLTLLAGIVAQTDEQKKRLDEIEKDLKILVTGKKPN